MAKCKCNCMNLINTRDSADGNHLLRLYECPKCLDKQVDVYKIIDSTHFPKALIVDSYKLLEKYGLQMINFIDF